MHAGPIRDALTLAAGVGTGMLSAAFGVGGATVSTPAIRALGASALVAVGTTLPSIFPSAVTGTSRYARAGLIRWRAVVWTVPIGLLTAVAGSLLSHKVPGHGHWLMIATAALLGLTALRMSRPRVVEARPEGAPARDRPTVLAAVGALAGLMSGLLGIGGGTVMVPGFSELVGMPVKEAIATSLACVAIFAIPSTVTHARLHDIDWRFALLLTVGVVPGARLGAAAALKATDRRMRVLVASFLGIVSVLYAAGEIAALIRG
jgi:uncharacterized membrane protein YfcA